MSIILQVYDGQGGLKLHPNEGFTDEHTPELTLSAESGELHVKFITDSNKNNAGFSAVFSADCPDLKPGKGAVASSIDTTFGAVVTFSCPTGQMFATGVSEITTTCQPGGVWQNDYIPDCHEVYCGPVPQIDNGFAVVASNVTYLGVAQFQCYAGFAFPSGNPLESITCLEDGSWSPLPNCQGRFVLLYFAFIGTITIDRLEIFMGLTHAVSAYHTILSQCHQFVSVTPFGVAVDKAGLPELLSI